MRYSVRQCVQRVSRWSAFEHFVGVLERLRRPHPKSLPVLTYHRVDERNRRPDLYPGLISATPDEFARQMRYLHDHRYPVSVHEVMTATAARHSLPDRAVLVTFDDAYEDFQRSAWPVMQQYRIPALMFVATSFPGQRDRRFWWDDLHAILHPPHTNSAPSYLQTPLGPLPTGTCRDRQQTYATLRAHIKSLPADQVNTTLEALRQQSVSWNADNGVLTWNALRQLAHEGVTLAPHTRHHPLVTRLPEVIRIREEVEGSWLDLEREIGPTPRVFAYPSGANDARTCNVLADLGFQLAFTTERGVNDLRRESPWRLKRINIGQATNVPLLRTQLAIL